MDEVSADMKSIGVDLASAGTKSVSRVLVGSQSSDSDASCLYSIADKSALTVSDNAAATWAINDTIGSYYPVKIPLDTRITPMNTYDTLLFQSLKDKFEPFIRNGVGGPLYDKLKEVLQEKLPDQLCMQITRNEGEAIITLRKTVNSCFPLLATIEHNLVIWHMPDGGNMRTTFVEHECDLHKVVKAAEVLVSYYNELEAKQTKLAHQFDILDTQENK